MTYFKSPWSDAPNAHVKTFDMQIDKRQIECTNFTVTIWNVDKTAFFVGQMDLSGLYKNDFLEDYNESNDQSWEKTVKLFTKQYDREIQRTKKEMGYKEYEIAAALREHNRNRNLGAVGGKYSSDGIHCGVGGEVGDPGQEYRGAQKPRPHRVNFPHRYSGGEYHLGEQQPEQRQQGQRPAC